MDYAKALKIARAIAGVRQQELAAMAGVDPSHISLIESGKRSPSVRLLGRISRALGIPEHLLTLLATERGDIATRDPTALSRAAESLARMLVRNGSKDSRKRHRRARPGRA